MNNVKSRFTEATVIYSLKEANQGTNFSIEKKKNL